VQTRRLVLRTGQAWPTPEHDDAAVAINGMGALVEPVEWRVCSDVTYTLGATLNITKDATAAYPITMRGRNAADTADATATFNANGGNRSCITLTTADFWRFVGIVATGTSNGAYHGWNILADADNIQLFDCGAVNNSTGSTSGHGFNNANGATPNTFVRCYASGNGGSGFAVVSTCTAIECIAYRNGVSGITGPVYCSGCIAANNSINGFSAVYYAASCVAAGNGGPGFLLRNYPSTQVDCIAAYNGGWGFQANASNPGSLVRCATIGNTSGRVSDTAKILDLDPIELTSDPFANRAAVPPDLRLSSITRGGQQCQLLAREIVPLGLTSWDSLGCIAGFAMPALHTKQRMVERMERVAWGGL
jgi:hypothetical protein